MVKGDNNHDLQLPHWPLPGAVPLPVPLRVLMMTTAALETLAGERARYVAFVAKHVGSRALAEDIVQQAFVKSLERGDTIRREESVVAWFYRMLRNAMIDYYRQRASSERAAESLSREWETHQEPDDVFKGEICKCVAGLLESIKPEYRQAIETVV